MKNKLIRITRVNGHIYINLFGLKIKFKNPIINQLGDCCCIPKLQRLKDNNTVFPYPVGIVISPSAIIGKNCTIYQNVTIGQKNGKNAAIIGDNVLICANACILGNIKIGDNAIIGAGAVVIKDVPANAVVAGNPAEVIKYNKN